MRKRSFIALLFALGCTPAPQPAPEAPTATPTTPSTASRSDTPRSGGSRGAGTTEAPSAEGGLAPAAVPTATATANTPPPPTPSKGCPCRLKEGGFDLELACGLTTCVDGTTYTCSKAGALEKGGRCGDESSCSCTVKVGEAGEAEMEIDCGLSACADGRQKACTKGGKLVDQGPCK